MASLPLANQVRQVYVVKTLKASGLPAQLGDLAVKGEAGKFIYFQHFGQGGLTATDKIDVENIRSLKQTPAADMNDVLKTHTVKVVTAVAGQTYILKVFVRNYVGQGVYDQVYRYGIYKAKASDNAAAIAEGLAKDLQKAQGLQDGDDATDINNYKEALFTVTYNSDTITISEVEQYWELPRFLVQQCPIQIFLNGIVDDSEVETYEWATIGEGDPVEVKNCAKKLAELEYFAHGWRGDFYGLKDYPRAFVTKYMVDPTEDDGYDTIDLHYFFRGQGVSSQLSEKEITLIVPAGNSTVLEAIQTLVGSDKICAPETYTTSEGAGSGSSS